MFQDLPKVTKANKRSTCDLNIGNLTSIHRPYSAYTLNFCFSLKFAKDTWHSEVLPCSYFVKVDSLTAEFILPILLSWGFKCPNTIPRLRKGICHYENDSW